MDVCEYENLPEGLDKDQLKKIFSKFFGELEADSYEDTCAKLEILCDKQWHTYELPDEDIQTKMRGWVVDNWRETEEHLELIMGICYSFGLDKELFARALGVYQGEHKAEYENDLKQSLGDFIDPYWSMRE